MSGNDALVAFDLLLDLDVQARSEALARLATEAPEIAELVAAWLAAEPRDDPRLVRDHYTPLVPPVATEVDAAGGAAGDRFGPYRLVRELGRGGMGSVWLAERVEGDFAQQVALKLIRPDLASPEAGPRFRRERQILAALKHPNIAQLLDGGVAADGRPWLAMEYIEGRSLRELVERGPMTSRRLLPLAAQLASGLAHAHASGVVHRDLKPDNVLLTREGFAKILDFGVAKLLAEDASAGTLEATQPGRVMGTTPYMSPEQAGGEPVDFRSDQFALGALLYEAATGKSAFARETPSQTVAAVLRDSPPAFESLSDTLPPGLVRIMRRCLDKEPAGRYGSTSDLARDLVELEAGTLPEVARPGSRSPVRVRAALVAIALAVAGAWWLGRSQAPAPAAVEPAARISAELPIAPAAQLWFGAFSMHAFALSPDGRRLVFAGIRDGQRMLYMRALDSREAVALPGSDGGTNPAFSPDGEWLAYFANNKLKKIPVGGGSAIVVAEAPNALGGLVWPEPDRIVFSPHPSAGIWDVAAAGGEPRKLTEPDVAGGEASHVWPARIPGTATLLYVAEMEEADSFDAGRIYAWDPASGKRTLLVTGGSDPVVLDDTLYYARAGTVYAVPFDTTNLSLRGSPKPLYGGVAYSPSTGAAQFAVGPGARLYLRGVQGLDRYEPVMVDRNGAATALGLAPAIYERVRISPDGRRLMFQITAADDDLWSYDLERKTLTRITDSKENLAPAWTPDGKDIIFSRHGTPVPPPPTLYRRRADGSGPVTEVLPAGEGVRARLYLDVSPDGRLVAFGQYTLEHNFDVWLLDLETGTPREWVSTPNSDITPRFSPDGRWLAYSSHESRDVPAHIYIQAVSGDSPRWKITTAGGTTPIWRGDGREVYFFEDGAVFAVSLQAGDDLAPAAPRLLFSGEYSSRYDVFADGERFLMMRRVPEPGRAGPLSLDTGPVAASD